MFRIRNRIDFGRLEPDPRGKKFPTKTERSEEISSYKVSVSAVSFCQFLVIKTFVPELDIDPDPYWPKMLDPDPRSKQCESETLFKRQPSLTCTA